MGNFLKIADLGDFEIASLDTSEIDRISDWFPKGGVIDLNVAERGMVLSLHGQNVCQEHIAKLDIWIGHKEASRSKAWRNAIERGKEAGWKTVKDKEWFAQADDEYIAASNELTLAKAAKKYFENKASNFSGWHYAFKTFLNRDYSLEKLGNNSGFGYNKGIDLGQEVHPPDQESSEDDSDNWGDVNDDNNWV